MPIALLSSVAAALIASVTPVPSAPQAGPGLTGTLTVEVQNVRVARGHVRLDVCPQARFLKDDCPYSGSAPAVAGTTVVTVRGLPPGRYAVQAYLDENDNMKVDRALFGIPKEGVGFSNDVKVVFSAPKFADTVFSFTGAAQTIRFKLQYFL